MALIILTSIAVTLIVYHNVLWPLLLKMVASPSPTTFSSSLKRDALPDVTLLIPVYNEQDFIAEKCWNLSLLDYPTEKLHIQFVLDGCTDNSEAILKHCLDHHAFQELNIQMIRFTENQGKVAILNKVIPRLRSEIVALSDTSALLATDSLLRAVGYFEQTDIGVVCPGYKIITPGSTGESHYWKYQRAIKTAESAMGSVIGAHGAFYLFRQSLFTPLENDTINDDFVLPLRIVEQGYRAVYAHDIEAVELECANLSMDWQRRIRLARGNLQQAIRLLPLCHPKHKGTALCFLSGKVLRAFMPFLLMIAGTGTAILMPAVLLGLLPFLLHPTIRYVAQGYLASIVAIFLLLKRTRHNPNRPTMWNVARTFSNKNLATQKGVIS